MHAYELMGGTDPYGRVVKPSTNSLLAVGKAIPLIIIVVWALASGCRRVGVQTIWSAEARSPDGHWLATARTEQHSGFGTAGLETDVYLKWVNGSKPPEPVLVFFHDPNNKANTINLTMKWVTPSQLDVTYNGRARVDLQVVRYGGVDISLHDLSGGSPVGVKEDRAKAAAPA